MPKMIGGKYTKIMSLLIQRGRKVEVSFLYSVSWYFYFYKILFTGRGTILCKDTLHDWMVLYFNSGRRKYENTKSHFQLRVKLVNISNVFQVS